MAGEHGIYIWDMRDIAFDTKAPDGKQCYVLYNNIRDENGFVYANKKRWDDDSYYAPFLIYKIGQCVGIEVPETEMDYAELCEMDDDGDYVEYSKRKRLFASVAIVYDADRLGKGKPPIWFLNKDINYIDQGRVREFYANPNTQTTDKRIRMEIPCNQTVDDYVNSNIDYIARCRRTTNQGYTESEEEKLKQQLIDRLLFSLRFGVHGTFEIKLRKNSYTELDSYYLASDNMFHLDDHDSDVQGWLEKSDEDFRDFLDDKYHPQYCIFPGQDIEKLTGREVIEYIYKHYPQQAQTTYEKLSKCTEADMTTILNECEKMSESHKVFALREFITRGQIFEQIHQQHIRTQGTDR